MKVTTRGMVALVIVSAAICITALAADERDALPGN
jgi:hypothetical protein